MGCLKLTYDKTLTLEKADISPLKVSWKRDAGSYRYGYQGQFSEKDDTNNQNEFSLRFYDARIAKWLTSDPYGQYYSPYVAMGNRPHMSVDPDGGFSVLAGAAIGAVVGGGIGYAVGGDWKSALIGAAAGAGIGAGAAAYANANALYVSGIGHYGANPARIASRAASSGGSGAGSFLGSNAGSLVASVGRTFLNYEFQKPLTGTLYTNEANAYNFMWNNSFRSGAVWKENFAWLTNKGVLVLPTINNTFKLFRCMGCQDQTRRRSMVCIA